MAVAASVVLVFGRYSFRMNARSRSYAGTTTSRITVAASLRMASWSAAGIVVGICVNGAKSGLVSSAFTYGSIVLSRPTTDVRGTENPRARPARMFAICSSK
jgi:hypothetical protein